VEINHKQRVTEVQWRAYEMPSCIMTVGTFKAFLYSIQRRLHNCLRCFLRLPNVALKTPPQVWPSRSKVFDICCVPWTERLGTPLFDLGHDLVQYQTGKRPLFAGPMTLRLVQKSFMR